MSYPYIPYYYLPYYVPPYITPYYDPITLMYVTMQWLWIPYYFAITIEMYRAILEAWKRIVEVMTRSLRVEEASK